MNPTLFIVALKSPAHPEFPEFAKHAAVCASKHSGCKPILLCDYREDEWLDVAPYRRQADKILSAELMLSSKPPLSAYSMSRWCIIAEYCSQHQITGPIISIDWECLVFCDLWTHFQRCGVDGCDYGACYDRERTQTYTSPIVLMNMGLLGEFVSSALEGSNTGRPPSGHGGDMVWWGKLMKSHNLKVTSVSHEVDGKLFDPNIVLDADRYEHDGSGKKVVIHDGKPHFIRKDGGLVQAVAVHCFMGWKNRTSELLAQAL